MVLLLGMEMFSNPHVIGADPFSKSGGKVHRHSSQFCMRGCFAMLMNIT